MQLVAFQHVAGGAGLPGHSALLAASAAAGGWPLQQQEALALAAAGAGPLGAGLQSMLLPDAAAVQAAVHAAAVQHQLAVMQASAAAAAAAADHNTLLAAATVRQPLHPLSLNLGSLGNHHPHFNRVAAAAVPSCFSGGL